MCVQFTACFVVYVSAACMVAAGLYWGLWWMKLACGLARKTSSMKPTRECHLAYYGLCKKDENNRRNKTDKIGRDVAGSPDVLEELVSVAQESPA